MNLNEAIIKLGLDKVLRSIFSDLEGIDFNLVKHDKKIQLTSFIDSVVPIGEKEWNLIIGPPPVIIKSYQSIDIDKEIDKLLLLNKIPKNTSYSDKDKPNITSWDGYGFKIQKISNESNQLILISKENVKPIDLKDKKSNIHPISPKIASGIKGFNKQVFSSTDPKQHIGEFISNDKEAQNIESISSDFNSQMKFFKKIVFEYNPEDEFLRIKDESIKSWLDKNPNEVMAFNINEKCQLMFSKEKTNYRVNLFPPGGITGSWDNLKEDEYEGPIPNVKFSKSLQTIRLQPDEVQTNEPEFDPISNDEEAKDQEGFFNDSIDDEIDYGEVDTSNSGGGIPRWLYYLMLVLAIFLLFRYCQFGSSRDGSYYYDRGVTYYESGDDRRALRDFDRAIDIDDSYTDPYIKRIEIYIKQGKYYEAIYDLDNVILVDNNNWYAYYLRGRAYLERAESSNASQYSPDYQKALDDFTSSITLNSLQENAMSFMLRGQVYKVLGSENACEDFYVACDYGVDKACIIVEDECYPRSGSMPYEEKFGAGLYGGGNNYRIDNTLGIYDVLLSIRRADTRYRVRSVFVRKGEEFMIENLPDGRYIIEHLRGNKWTTRILRDDGITKGGFLQDENFGKIKEGRNNLVINLYNRVSTGLMYNSPDGDLTSEDISENEFLN
tara:strand:+ start:1404 stop:3395 length:1992 start_codon:yes stop_codon:yes gene_type:complete